MEIKNLKVNILKLITVSFFQLFFLIQLYLTYLFVGVKRDYLFHHLSLSDVVISFSLLINLILNILLTLQILKVGMFNLNFFIKLFLAGFFFFAFFWTQFLPTIYYN
jgi:hypothetical protein